MATCRAAILLPIRNSENIAIGKVCSEANRIDPQNATENIPIMTRFSPNRSTRKPAGMENAPYAAKKKKGRSAATKRLT